MASFQMSDTALIGSAVIAGVGCGMFENYREPIEKVKQEGIHILPDEKKTALYKIYAEAYLKAIDAVGPIYKML